MKYFPTELEGVVLIEPQVHSDHRGYFLEIYNEKEFLKAGITQRFVQDNQSHSRKGVLRGMHYQLESPQGKLIRVLRGEIFDVAVDVRPDSKSFGRWVAVPEFMVDVESHRDRTLSTQRRTQSFVLSSRS